MEIEIVNKSDLPLPEYKTEGSSGIDLYANLDSSITIKQFGRVLVPTGIYVSIPKGYEGQIRARSGLALKHGISLANGIGTIDSDYRGEIKVILINFGDEPFIIEKGDRIGQLVFLKYETVKFKLVEKLDETERGSGGFGHTGF
ncbi:MAG TPA: dUTP diphosphatase [Tissierellales bacterium]|nr:dUTP diphosphatase [Tissierellales bacterium]